ncbi:PREDICTED: olfactory receptor 7G2-like [Chrysochloris asiatica]|uniref:Olfactory receptor n=1 Tax=Chrysochloris asiatica TaxID=185453 RepID=A0A9B0X3U3_CHRAS|nr:PREDICTED: olfactory receptor 7G2-like [Chrysochloris asiatica]
METENQTGIAEFILLGLSENPELQSLLFGMFLSIYLITVTGNFLIILAISSNSHLHIPMYFFLSNLSFTDICFSTTTVIKMLVNIQTHTKSISYTGCLTQLWFVLVFADLENCLLAVMAYDRYVAICHPLRYTVIMNPLLCGLLILLSLLISILNALLHGLMVLCLSFCTDLKIPQFFCELAQVLKLACSDTSLNSIILYFMMSTLGGGPFLWIIYSYIKIISSILKMPSKGGMYKAFSTCGSHLSVVALFYGTGFGVYLSSMLSLSARNNVAASVMYSVVTPMLNPFIYSLRNNDMMDALRKLIFRASSFH